MINTLMYFRKKTDQMATYLWQLSDIWEWLILPPTYFLNGPFHELTSLSWWSTHLQNFLELLDEELLSLLFGRKTEGGCSRNARSWYINCVHLMDVKIPFMLFLHHRTSAINTMCTTWVQQWVELFQWHIF